MIEPDLSAYRPNVGVALLNKKGKVWLGRRVVGTKHKEHLVHRWQMPQGGIDEGEDAEEAAFRELYEETGVRSARLLTMTPGWLAYDFPPEYRKKKWRGQRQRWAVMLFEGKDAEIDLRAHPPQEFDDWRWAKPKEAATLIVPFKRGVYEALAETIVPLAAYVAKR